MYIRNIRGARPFALASITALGITLASVAPASAAAPHSASVDNEVLNVTGTSGDDEINLHLAAGDPNTLVVDFGDGSAGQSFDRSTFTGIDVSLGSGDDVFNVQQGAGSFANEDLVVDGGSGNDTLTGGDNNATLIGGAGNDTILGGNGTETIDAGSGKDFVDGNRGNDTADLGPGQDTFQWDPGDGSDAFDGGSGTDTLVFNGANINEKMSLSANGSHSVFLRDVANIRMDMDNVEQLTLRALGGADTIAINDMTGTDFTRADVDLSATGGGGDGSADNVTVFGSQKGDNVDVSAAGTTVDVRGLETETRISGAEQANDHLQLNTQGGNDSVKVAGNVSTVIGVNVDLGTGQR